MNEEQNPGEVPLEVEEGSERLSRFLAHAGVASRRHAEELISAGRVQVNGATITVQGTKVNAEHDLITVDGRRIQPQSQQVYIMINKPMGYVSTASDPEGRPTVLDLLPRDLRSLRLYPVGRLDIDTNGLLLLTNDGDFALHLAHPRYNRSKHYRALIGGHPTPAALQELRTGIDIHEDDGHIHRTSPAQVRVQQLIGPNALIELTIHEGHKRQIRRMFAAIGHPVKELSRTAIGDLTLRNLPIGHWRHLTPVEVSVLLT